MPELGALIQVGHAGDRQLEELLRQALDPVGRVERVDEGRDLGDEAGVAEEIVDEVVQGALRYSSDGPSQSVKTLASRAAFSTWVCARSRVSGQAPTSV